MACILWRGCTRNRQQCADFISKSAMDEQILRRIANCAFVTKTVSGLGYCVDWRTLGRLACTCRGLRTHLAGLRTLYDGYPGSCDNVELTSRWDLRRANMLGVYRDRFEFYLPFAWFQYRMRHPELALPSIKLPSPNGPNRAERRRQKRRQRQQQKRHK